MPPLRRAAGAGRILLPPLHRYAGAAAGHRPAPRRTPAEPLAADGGGHRRAAAAVVLWLSRPGGTPPEDTADKEDAAQAAADPYLAACQTYYTGADGREYHVFTAVTPSIEGRTDPVGYRSELIPAGGTVDFPPPSWWRTP